MVGYPVTACINSKELYGPGVHFALRHRIGPVWRNDAQRCRFLASFRPHHFRAQTIRAGLQHLAGMRDELDRHVVELQLRDGAAQRIPQPCKLRMRHQRVPRERRIRAAKALHQIDCSMIEQAFQTMQIMQRSQQCILYLGQHHDRNPDHRPRRSIRR